MNAVALLEGKLLSPYRQLHLLCMYATRIGWGRSGGGRCACICRLSCSITNGDRLVFQKRTATMHHPPSMRMYLYVCLRKTGPLPCPRWRANHYHCPYLFFFFLFFFFVLSHGPLGQSEAQCQNSVKKKKKTTVVAGNTLCVALIAMTLAELCPKPTVSGQTMISNRESEGRLCWFGYSPSESRALFATTGEASIGSFAKCKSFGLLGQIPAWICAQVTRKLSGTKDLGADNCSMV